MSLLVPAITHSFGDPHAIDGKFSPVRGALIEVTLQLFATPGRPECATSWSCVSTATHSERDGQAMPVSGSERRAGITEVRFHARWPAVGCVEATTPPFASM